MPSNFYVAVLLYTPSNRRAARKSCFGLVNLIERNDL